MYVPCYTCYGWNTASGLRSGARATAGGGRSGPRVVAAARLRMRLRVLLEEADALIDVLRVPVDGRHRDAGEVVREEAAGSVVVAVGGAVAAALPVRGAAGEEAQVPRAPRGDAAEDFDDERHHVVVLVVDGVIVVALVEGDVALAGVVVEGRVGMASR